MKILCDRCKREYELEEDIYQDENTNSQKDGQERLCPDCEEDKNL